MIRPDAVNDPVPSGGYQTIHYARTRQVGVYRVDPGIEGKDRFAVNLFDPHESHVAPASTLVLGAARITTEAGHRGWLFRNRATGRWFLHGWFD